MNEETQTEEERPKSNYENNSSSSSSSSSNEDYRDNRDNRDKGGDMGGDGDRRRHQRPRYRKKILDTRGLDMNYKNSEVMERFVSKTGKILPRRMTGATAKIQRKIAREIKRARMINLLPITKR